MVVAAVGLMVVVAYDQLRGWLGVRVFVVDGVVGNGRGPVDGELRVRLAVLAGQAAGVQLGQDGRRLLLPLLPVNTPRIPLVVETTCFKRGKRGVVVVVVVVVAVVVVGGGGGGGVVVVVVMVVVVVVV